MQYYLAIDIGASSGRHILAWLEDGRILTEEIYRFENKMLEREGSIYWDIDALTLEICNGLQACKAAGKIPFSLGIDTWGVDYVLLDEAGSVLSSPYHYRDARTTGMDSELEAIISTESLYKRSGIQKQSYNTIYQLMAEKKQHPEKLNRAANLLMMPSYFNYYLSGVKLNEYTHASTSSLVHVETRDWDWDLINNLGLPNHIFTDIVQPGQHLGRLRPEIIERVGFDCDVFVVPSHDTASAYLAVPARDEQAVYLSSGTWSLLGVENDEAILTAEAAEAGFTNEGAYANRFRFLKNIMGLWMIQSLKREMNPRPSFRETEALARSASSFSSIVDVNDDRFMAPPSMAEALRSFCRESGQLEPQNFAECLVCVYKSLAAFYKLSVQQLEEITKKQYTSMNIVGGGSQDQYLNELTAAACNMPVYAGPAEATVIGNVLSQMIHAGQVEDLSSARELLGRSFDVKSY